ncbi:MAG: DNA mismatch repair endonuclease MutL, partial [Oscillospiraceae bacterium]
DGDLKNTIAGLFGTEFAQELTAVNYSDGKYKISGYITLAHCSRQSRNMQFAFINGRYVKNKTIIAAVENAYKGSTMVGKFPGYVLNVQMPFEIVDVNVHPAKTEVRFANDGEIFSIVYRAVKIALGANTQLKEFSFTPKQPTTFFVDKENIVQQGIEENQPSQSLKINIVSKAYDNQNPAAKVWEDLPSDDAVLNSDKNITPYMLQDSCKQSDYIAPIISRENVPVQQVDVKKETTTTAQSEGQAQPEAISVIGELFNTYILCESGNSLIMVDKHAAHERLIYERLKRSQSCDNQMLLSPINIKLSAEEKEAILENLDVLSQQGFIIEDFGLSGVLLRAIPMNISSQDPQSLINEIAHNMVDNSRLTLSEKHEWILHSVACRSAIKAGDRASNKELMELMKDIQQEKIPLFCPHGRPVIITITKKELEKQFGRA